MLTYFHFTDVIGSADFVRKRTRIDKPPSFWTRRGLMRPQDFFPLKRWLPNQHVFIKLRNTSNITRTFAPGTRRRLVAQQFQLSSYLSFVLLLMMAIAIAFQMPLVLLLLGWVGIVTPQWLRDRRKYALAVLAVISVLITPQDIISMLMMLVPLYMLYEVGIAMMAWLPASRVAGERQDHEE